MTRPTTHWSATGDLHTGAVDGCGACDDAGPWLTTWQAAGTPFPDWAEHASETDAHAHALRVSARFGVEVAVVRGEDAAGKASLRPVAAPLAPEQAQQTVRDPHDAQEGAQ